MPFAAHSFDRIKDVAHLTIRGNLVEPIESAQVADDRLIVMAGINELYQGGPFELTHGQCRTQGVWRRETDTALALSVSNPGELCSRDPVQSQSRKILSQCG